MTSGEVAEGDPKTYTSHKNTNVGHAQSELALACCHPIVASISLLPKILRVRYPFVFLEKARAQSSVSKIVKNRDFAKNRPFLAYFWAKILHYSSTQAFSRKTLETHLHMLAMPNPIFLL